MNEGMKDRFSNIPITPEGSSFPNNRKKQHKIRMSEPLLNRRQFLIGGAALLGGALLSKIPASKENHVKKESQEVLPINQTTEPQATESKVVEKESLPTVLTPLEQLQAYGEIRDMEAGLQVFHDEHYNHLTHTKDGLHDMQIAVKNIARYDFGKLVKPYEERGLPSELAFMIAIQETRGRVQKSRAGARGMTGILPRTAKSLGFNAKDADNPYLASTMTAEYLAVERDERFGETDIEMLLHSYSAGGGLFGFTEAFPKKERTKENFYRYMEQYVNSRFKEIKEKGYRHVLDDEDKTLEQVSQRFDVPLEAILKANGFTKKTVIHEGDSVLIPFENLEQAAKVVFRKPFEALRYAPEVRAKFKALKDSGLLTGLKAHTGMNKSVLG